MDKKKKGLVDDGEGEFILNESGSSVSSDKGPADDQGPAEENSADNADLQKGRSASGDEHSDPLR